MPETETSETLRRLEAELRRLESESQLRRLGRTEGIDLCSNDYLGLSRDPRLKDAVIAALKSGAGMAGTGSRLLSGNAPEWEQLESDFARFIGSESALFFSSGYAANLGLLASLLRPDDTVFSDASNHASLIDGIRLSRAKKVIFPHLDLNFLEDALKRAAFEPGEKFILVESLFSMDGDRAPVAELVALAERYGAELIIDEAHATGVFGPNGRGLVAGAGANRRVLASIHTCGKALASAGAFVCCSETLKQFLVNRARTFIFSTALPPYLAAQISKAVEIVSQANAKRARLQNLSDHLRNQLQAEGFDTGASDSQIVPIILGANETALHFAEELCHNGYAVRPIRPPTVPVGTARLRLSVNLMLPDESVEKLVPIMIHAREREGVATAHEC